MSKNRIIKIYEYTFDFAENKDTARDIRVKKIEPTLQKGYNVVLDFTGVNSATQSFIHALISDIIRKYKVTILDKIAFKKCNSTIRTLVRIVVEYVQDGMNIKDNDDD